MKSLIKTQSIASATFLACILAAQPALAEDADPALPEGAAPVEVTESADDAARREALESVETNRDEVVAEIVTLFRSDDENANLQLEVSLQQASPEQLLAAQDAQNIDEVNSILSGSASGEFDGVTAVNMGKLEFVPITPCRIVDTRKVGGQFAPNNMREFYVYGALAASQGGATCTSPVGEPKGVMINMAVVPVSGGGSFVAYPANVSAPLAGVINYKSGVQNISNASSVKTYYSGGRDIEVLNRGGYAHLIIDVLGYYADPTVGADYAGGNQYLSNISTNSASPTTVRSIYVYSPEDTTCVASASASIYSSGTNFLYCSINQNTTAVDLTNAAMYVYHSTGTHYNQLSGTRGFSHPAGGRTYRLMCYRSSATGSKSVYDSQITAVCTKNRY